MTKPPPPPRDWDKELAEIDRLMANQPAAPPPPPSRRATEPGLPGAAPVRAAPARGSGRTLLAAWLRVLLGVALAAAMTQWPYGHECGLRLYLYLGAAGFVGLAGIWGMVTTWKRRMPFAHLIALGVVLFGALLVGQVVLDRTDYVKVPHRWSCGG